MQQAVLNDECIALERGEGKREGKGVFLLFFLIMGCFTWVDYGRFYLLIYLCGGADVLLLLVKTGNVFLNDEFDLIFLVKISTWSPRNG